MSLKLNELSCNEQKAVEELRARMKNRLKPHFYENNLALYRFLKARDFDVDKAESMLNKHIIWRKVNQIDTILEDFKPKEYFQKYVEPSAIGYDKDGDLVMYVPAGKIETREVLKCDKMNAYMKHWIWYAVKEIDNLTQQNARTGRNGSKATLILDLDKLTFGNATYKGSADLFLRLTNIYQDNYPEYMKAAYVINAPAYYLVIFTILKAVMSSVMIKKIQVFGYNGWKEKLLELLDADDVPVFLGGNRKDPDGDTLCRSSINHGGKIPSAYYLSDEERYFKNRSGVSKMMVSHSKKKEIYVDVKEKGWLIQWEFYTKSSDIAFGLYYYVPEQELQEVIPIEKYDTSDGTEKGSYKTQFAGKYVLVFDNSYSWLRSKEVEYCITVVKPEL